MQGICQATLGVVAPRSNVPPAQRSFEGNPCSDAGRNVKETFYRVKAGEKSENYGPGGRDELFIWLCGLCISLSENLKNTMLQVISCQIRLPAGVNSRDTISPL